MKKLNTKRFYSKATRVPTKPGCWDYELVEIFDREQDSQKIGEYIRNYALNGEETFTPFFLYNRWWALYSKDYTATRVMTLPDCKDWCGEEESANGFCPVEYLIPFYLEYDIHLQDQIVASRVWNDDALEELEGIKEGLYTESEYHYKDVHYTNFGFILGCHWGGPYTVGYIDLTKLEEKQIKIDRRFGQIDLPEKMSLKEAIDLSKDCSGDPMIVDITTVRTYELSSGEDITF